MNSLSESVTPRDAWLHSLIRPELRPYSERAPLALASVGALLHRVGNPHHGLKCVHIAGSKGKGSTALMIEALLEQAGLRTGTYTSPHLERWSERFRVDGREVSEQDFDEVLDLLKPHVDAQTADQPDSPPSFFDVCTAAALILFEREQVDVAIIETGIGGRYDATNIIDPAVACITNVELEHTDKLGTDIASIAFHKAGILKPPARAVLGAIDGPAAEVVRRALESFGGEADWLGKSFGYESESRDAGQRLRFQIHGHGFELHLNHPGRQMADNAAVALACAYSLLGFDSARLEAASKALASIQLPGRAEVLRTEPWIVVDAAHTAASIRALMEMLDAIPARERHFLISLSGDKPAELLAPLIKTAASVTVTRPEPLRSTPAQVISKEISAEWPEIDVHAEADVSRALDHARSKLAPDALLCATGSTYLAGAVRRLLKP